MLRCAIVADSFFLNVAAIDGHDWFRRRERLFQLHSAFVQPAADTLNLFLNLRMTGHRSRMRATLRNRSANSPRLSPIALIQSGLHSAASEPWMRFPAPRVPSNRAQHDFLGSDLTFRSCLKYLQANSTMFDNAGGCHVALPPGLQRLVRSTHRHPRFSRRQVQANARSPSATPGRRSFRFRSTSTGP